MVTVKRKETGVVGYDLCEITPLEMHQMIVIFNRIMSVLRSHKPGNNNEKKEYLDDTELLTIASILHVLTRECGMHQKHSEFDDAREFVAKLTECENNEVSI